MGLSNLTRNLLSQIGKGITSTKVLPVSGGSVDFSTLDFGGVNAGQIFSIEGSFAFDWGESTLTEIKIDQGLDTIDVKIEQGEVTFAANYPTIAEDALKEFFQAGKEATVIASGTGESAVKYKGTSFFTDPKSTEVSLLVEDQNQAYAVTIARVSITARLAYDTDTKVWYIGLNGRVLSNLKEGEGDMFVGKRVV